MTSTEFRAALAKGMGRTALAVQRGDPEAHTTVLLAACLENLQYDRSFEESRAPYMMRLINLADLRARALEAILLALPACEEEVNRDWMIDLLGEFAKHGEPRAWGTLAELSAQGVDRAYAPLARSGEEGLRWIATHVLPGLSEDGRWQIYTWLPDDEEDDATPTQRRLRALDAENLESPRQKAEPPASVQAFLASLDDPSLPYASPRDFARLATPAELRAAARRLLRETRPAAVRHLARVFSVRRFPLSLRRLFAQATHEERGRSICRILETIDAPRVRRFALRLLRKRPLPLNAIRVLTASFRAGDEAAVAPALPLAEGFDEDDLHGVILDVVNLLGKHPGAKWQPHAEWVYEHSPCSMCRGSAVDWMSKHGSVPGSIREEAPYDAESEIRKVATEDQSPSRPEPRQVSPAAPVGAGEIWRGSP